MNANSLGKSLKKTESKRSFASADEITDPMVRKIYIVMLDTYAKLDILGEILARTDARLKVHDSILHSHEEQIQSLDVRVKVLSK